jgi:hypothetical protein
MHVRPLLFVLFAVVDADSRYDRCVRDASAVDDNRHCHMFDCRIVFRYVLTSSRSCANGTARKTTQ